MNLKGTLPMLILDAVEEEPKYGYRIAQQIKQRSEGVLDFKEGTLYPALHDLEKRGYLESYMERQKGRQRRYYRITEQGTRTLAKERKEWRQLSAAVKLVMEGA